MLVLLFLVLPPINEYDRLTRDQKITQYYQGEYHEKVADDKPAYRYTVGTRTSQESPPPRIDT